GEHYGNSQCFSSTGTDVRAYKGNGNNKYAGTRGEGQIRHYCRELEAVRDWRETSHTSPTQEAGTRGTGEAYGVFSRFALETGEGEALPDTADAGAHRRGI